MADTHHDRSSEEIRRDIEGTRADMHETVDALERKLSPGQIMDRAWDRAGGASGSALSGAANVVRDHPVPLALMGLGVAWLAVERTTGSDSRSGDRARGFRGSVGPGTERRAEGRVGPYRGDEIGSEESLKDRAASAARSVGQKASSAARTVADKASSAASSAGEMASGVGEKTSSAAGRARREMNPREMRHRSRRLAHDVRSTIEEQPLVMGAVAFGLGLAGGLAAPTTRWEDEMMGGASDAFLDEAKTAARDMGEGAKRVAEDSARAAGDEAQRQGRDLVEDAEESARKVAAEAKETASRRAREEGLTPESARERSSRAAERVREKATD